MEYVAKFLTSLGLFVLIYFMGTYVFEKADFTCIAMLTILGGLFIVWIDPYKILDRVLTLFE